jgi:hypothetical protein
VAAETQVPVAGAHLASEHRLGHTSIVLVTALLTLHVTAALVVMLTPSSRIGQGDVSRFTEIANTPGRPYRDFPVEYAPGELLGIELTSGASLSQTRPAVAAVAILADLATWLLLARVWGRRAGAAYLGFAIPLMPLLFLGFYALPGMLAVAGFAWIRRRRQELGGVALAAAALTKVWPAVLAPALLIRRQHRAAAWFAGACAAGGALWIAYGGIGAIGQVATFRGAHGWQVESTVGAVLWAVTGGPLRVEQGAVRVGTVPGWAGPALALVLVALSVAAWRRARRWGGSVEGVPSMVAIVLVVVLSPLFSLQYVAWLLPWMAIASGEDEGSRRFVDLGVAAVLVTGIVAAIYIWSPYEQLMPLVRALVLLRNAVCVGIVLRWFGPLRIGPARAEGLKRADPI